MNLTFNRRYFCWFLILLITEIAIAVFLKSGFIRHTFGDFLAVILLYCFFTSFWRSKPLKVGIIVLIIAFIIEFLQLFGMLEFFNLQQHHILKIIMGSTFHMSDLIAYTLGVLTILIIEFKLKPDGSN